MWRLNVFPILRNRLSALLTSDIPEVISLYLPLLVTRWYFKTTEQGKKISSYHQLTERIRFSHSFVQTVNRLQNKNSWFQIPPSTESLTSQLLLPFCINDNCIGPLSSAEQHSQLPSQVFVGAAEERCTSHTIKGQAQEEHVCTQPWSEESMEVVERDDKQSGEVNPNQSDCQPADQQVGLCRAAPLRLRRTSAEVDHQA